jgi:thiamine-phosphate pyrophosphorylase
MTARPAPPPPPRLLAISDRRALAAAGSSLERWLEEIAVSGVDAVQLREKDLDDADLYALARQARTVLPAGCRLLINGRPDIALAAGADGVHLPVAGLPVAAVAGRWGRRLLVGVSAHRVDEVEAARRDGAAYALFGPVFATPSKPAAAGLDRLVAATAMGLPVIAVGGVTAERLPDLAAAGAAGAAGIRCFAEPTSIAAMVQSAADAFAGWSPDR